MRHSDSAVRRLEDIDDIKCLKARYFRFLDTKAWEELRSVFADDRRFCFGPDENSRPTVMGADAFVTAARTTLRTAITVPHGHTTEIEMIDATHVRGVWAWTTGWTTPSTVELSEVSGTIRTPTRRAPTVAGGSAPRG